LNIAQGLLPFQLVEDSSKVLRTSFSGLPMVMETFRALGLPQSIAKHLALHKRAGKYEEADYVESFLAVFAAGGDCFDEFELLRQDLGLQKLGLKVPSPESARFFVNAFHEEEKLQGRIPHERGKRGQIFILDLFSFAPSPSALTLLSPSAPISPAASWPR